MTIDFDFPVEIIRTDRKLSASIQFDGDTIKVTVPKSLSDKRVQDLIREKKTWIKQKIKLHSELPPFKPKEYVNGESFTYLGRNYRLKKVLEGSEEVKINHGYIEITVPQNLLKEKMDNFIMSSLTKWYEQNALTRLREKTNRYSSILGIEPRSIKVKNYRSQWGSCSISGDISYNWRIIIAPHRIVDYVVVHELCHILEKNHSPRYWRHVENVISDFRECKEWLKTNSMNLII